MEIDRIAALEARIATLEREVATARSDGAERIGEVMDPERGHLVPSPEQFAEQLTVQLVSLLSRSGVDLRKAWLDIRHTFDGDPGVGAREVFETFDFIIGGPNDVIEPVEAKRKLIGERPISLGTISLLMQVFTFMMRQEGVDLADRWKAMKPVIVDRRTIHSNEVVFIFDAAIGAGV